jgi:uncharacterized protein YerC
MKKKMGDLTDQEKMETLDLLYTAAGTVKGREATKEFLKDLLTPSERIMLGRRIWIARLLLSGESQAEIGRILKVGPNTVWRVEKWLSDKMPGYEKAIAGLEKEMTHRAEKREAYAEPFSFRALKKKYPLHFLLFPSTKPKK